MKQPILFLIIIILFHSCQNEKKADKKNADTTAMPTRELPAAHNLSQQDSIKAIGQQVLTSLKGKNYTELIKYFSSDGVLFSPYGHIDTLKSKRLNPDDFLLAIDKKWVLTWGSYDGTGDPIRLTIPAYLQKFVYNADYLNAEAVGYDQILKEGNSLNNIKAIYKNKHFIDYHFSGFDQKLNGMDWTSLRLVFEKHDGQYFLLAVIHDQWTI